MKRATFAIFYSKDIPEISIHALMKRATMLKDSVCVKVGISIHALMKRATK